MSDDHDIERGPVRRTRTAGPQPIKRPTTAPLESSEVAEAYSSRRAARRRDRPETNEIVSHGAFDGIVPPLDDGVEADGAIERTLGFDESLSSFDEDERAQLQKAVARSLEAEHGALAALTDASSTIDFEADVAHRYAGLSPDETIDFARDSEDSLDRAIVDLPVDENPTDVEFPRPDTRPLGGMNPSEWAAHVLKACHTLADHHADGMTFDGRFDLDEDGVVGQSRLAEPGSDSLRVDVRRMHHLVGVIAEAVRAGSDHSPTALVVADALAELKAADSATTLARGLMRALGARTARQHRRMAAEFEAVDARRRALATQRRLRADLAARLTRLDASISAQAAAVARDEDRVKMLTSERKALDALMELVGSEDADAEGFNGAGASDDASTEASRDPEEQRSDAVRRLLGA